MPDHLPTASLPPDPPKRLLDETDEVIRQFIADLKAGMCPICQQAMTRVKRGRHVYASPCGHRLYQGHLPLSGKS